MKLKDFLKNNYSVFLAPILTVVVLLFAYAVGGVFPFGSKNVEYYDMAQGIIPNFYHIWDALHRNDVALWFNWYTGLGVNDTANASLSAFWAVLLIVPRHWVGKLMSFYVMMMLALSSFTASIFLKVECKTNAFITTALSICYGFCGFSVMYYTNGWQDTVYLFPLFILTWSLMMKKGKCLPYIAMIVLNLLCGYYVFVLALFYMFFMSFLYIALCVEKQERGRKTLHLGLSTLLGVGVSGFFFVPKMMQVFSSERFVEKSGFDFSNVLEQYWDTATRLQCESYDKISMLFCTALPIAIVVLGVIKNRENKKINLFFGLNILFLAVLIVCEGSNVLMHLGDYKLFPMRMGYALSFGLVWGAGYYSKLLNIRDVDISKKNLPKLLVSVAVFVVAFFAVCLMLKKLDTSRDFIYSCVMATPFLTAVCMFSLSRYNKFFDYRAVLAVVLAEAVVLSCLYIPYWNTDQLSKEHSPKYISTTQSLVKALDIEESKTERVKTIGTTLNTNYGTIAKHSTIANWTHLIPHEAQQSLIAMGYSSEYTRLHDSGGTAFTDALLGVTKVLSVKQEEESLYTLVDKAKGYKYYQCKYTLPYGIVVSDDVLDIDVENSNWMDINNQLYTALSGDKESIVKNADLTLIEADKKVEKYSFHSSENTVAYFKLEGAKSVNILVNGSKVKIPSVDAEKNKKYPGRFNRNLLCLGAFGDADVELTLILNDGKYEDDKSIPDDDERKQFNCEVGLLNLDKLQAVCSEYSQNYDIKAKNYSLSTSVNSADDNKVLLLPMQYNKCWTVRVNDKTNKVEPVMDLLSAVKLDSGSNQIDMKFAPNGFKKGVMISLVSALALAVILILKRKGIKAPNWLCNIVYYAYCGAFVVAFVLVYAVPIAYLCYRLVTSPIKTITVLTKLKS